MKTYPDDIGPEHIAPELPTLITYLNEKFQNSEFILYLKEWENIFFSVIISLIVSLVCYLGAKKKEKIPHGLQNLLEFFVERLNVLSSRVIGPEEGYKYIVFLGTLFIYIFSMNLAGLVPLFKAPTASLNITLALGICVFVYVQYLNVKNMGFKGFLYHLAGSPKDLVSWLMVPLMLPIEIITQLSRPLTLALRLVGNVMGEETLIAYFALIGVIILPYLEIQVPLPLQIPFMLLGMLTSFMQAGVFTLLSAIYIYLSIPHKENH